MYCVAGLGNPGKKYSATRHNVGFLALDAVASRISAPSSREEKFSCQFAKIRFGENDLLLAWPQLFMNCSGEALAPLVRYFKIDPADIIVIYDELDLAPGTLRVRRGGSAAGHRGVADIIEQLGTDDFFRVRTGIGHPRDFGGGDPADWVLRGLKGSDFEALKAAAQRAGDAALALIEIGLDAAQREYHKPIKAP